MSVTQVEQALVDFAVADQNRAVVLKGEWGTGKTHLWRQVVLKKRDSFKLSNYAYVSLFGLNSLKDLKQALYENKVVRAQAHLGPDSNTFEENLRDLRGRFAGWWRRSSSLLQEVSAFGVRGIAPVIQSLQFFRVTDTLICLDDFERKGAGLHDREVMGLISLLLESKKCRVVMLLNDHALPSHSDFPSYHEKVFDYELEFSPSLAESAALVFKPGDDSRKLLAENCVSLKINNVRLLRKIEYYATVLNPILHGRSPDLIRQAHHTLPLAVHSAYGGANAKVSIDFILRYEGEFDSTLPDDEATPEEVAQQQRAIEQREYLREYGFTICDELDVAVISLVRKGYADPDALAAVALAFEEKFQHGKDIALLSQAWQKLHSSFLDNEQEVVDAFEAALEVSINKIGLSDLDSVVCLFDDLGKGPRAMELVDQYFAVVAPVSGWKDKSDIFRWPRHKYVAAKLNSYFDNLVIDKPIAELIEHGESVGFGSGDVRLALARKSEGEFYEYFSSLDSELLTADVRRCLDCGKVVSGDEAIQRSYQDIFLKTYRTISRLGQESTLNKIRLAKFSAYDQLFEELQPHAELKP